MELSDKGNCGSAKADGGKASPFRLMPHLNFGEAAPRPGGVASHLCKDRTGKAKPYRSVRRQSRKLSSAAAAFVLLFALAFSNRIHSRAISSSRGLKMAVQQGAKIRAPELTGDRGWLNTDKPLSLAGLKGKVVLLDFWTYGCINCIHIIPDLKKLEKKYPNELVVIGVHSAKFENEKDTENIRRIILR